MTTNPVFKKLQDAVDYFYSEEIEGDILALPPDVDELTDEEVLDDETTGIPIVTDIAGYVEVQHNERENNSDEEDNLPLSLLVPKKKMKGEKFQKPITNWIKANPEYNADPVKYNCRGIEDNLKGALHQASPLEIFENFFDDGIYDLIWNETIRYATTQKNKQGWSIRKENIKIFIGFLIFSGYHTLPSERDYWSDEDDLGQSIVKNALSRNAYLEIKSLIHFADNTKALDNRTDKYFKIRPLMEKMQTNFKKFGVFQENLSIDEMMVRYYGRHSMKQFIRTKPIRFGYKLWALCGEDGYCFSFSPYAGKEDNQSNTPLGTRVILSMLSVVKNPKCYCIYFDNFFSSHALFVRLKEMKFRATGTIRENRTARCPVQPTKELERLPRGSYDFRFDTENKILVVKWNDNKCVSIASNFDTITPMATVTRWNGKTKSRMPIQQPRIIFNYNQYMGGVDHHDWLLEKYSIAIRGKKWYWCLFTRIIDMAMINSFLLYRRVNGKNSITLKDFRREIAISYLKLGHGRSVMKGRPLSLPSTSKTYVPDNVRLDEVGHFLEKRKNQRRCQYPSCKSRP
ncbi:piggyBac transposable element-derived protein 2-like [Euwallacea similis]|uniref:piggyBac transposable element-derived protein 2-like n=1 Tax=Euwallacea similis TaxID=1736056 RepID=UPI00344B3179